MNNTIHFSGSDDAAKLFLQSTIDSCETVLSHYDFVLSDISSDISNPALEASKGPAIDFLYKMRREWQASRDQAQAQLDELLNRK